MKQHFFNWHQIVQQNLEEFNYNRSRFFADKSLQNAVDMYIKDYKKQYNLEEAEILFNVEWKKIE